MSSSPSSSSSATGFPVVAISIVGILSTAAFLLGYYVFVIKCCLNLNRSDSNDHILRRFSRSRRDHHRQFRPAAAAASTERRGLDPSSIRAIPTFRYSATAALTLNECAVCLLEFRDEERLRLLPGCAHAFHIDCIDTWLSSNANCPLCRSEVTHTSPLAADRVVIDVGEVTSAAAEEKKAGKWRGLAGSLGDECVEVRRQKEEVFAVQAMRRSLSMDSSGDRQLYVAVQEAIRRNPDLLFREVEGGRGGGGGSGRRPFFSFGRSRSSMRGVLPVELDV